MNDLKKQVEELTKQVEDIMVQLKESDKYRRDYGNVEVFDTEVQLRSGLSLKRLATNDTDLPIGRVWNSSGTLKIKQ